MNGEIIGFLGLGLLGTINLASAAYYYGKLKQKVDGLCDSVREDGKRINRLEELHLKGKTREDKP